jgi:IS5 family transposase
MRWREHGSWGLPKNLTSYGLAAITHNIKKGGKFLILCGLPEPTPTG